MIIVVGMDGATWAELGDRLESVNKQKYARLLEQIRDMVQAEEELAEATGHLRATRVQRLPSKNLAKA